MTGLREINNQEFLKELQERVINKKLSEEQVFQILHSPLQEVITEYEITDIDKLSKEDWKKAYHSLDQDKVYQEETKLWETIDEETN